MWSSHVNLMTISTAATLLVITAFRYACRQGIKIVIRHSVRKEEMKHIEGVARTRTLSEFALPWVCTASCCLSRKHPDVCCWGFTAN